LGLKIKNKNKLGTDSPVILATWEANIRKIMVQGQPWQIVQETPSPKQPEKNELEIRSSSRDPVLQK
jgi:hypothetical protein